MQRKLSYFKTGDNQTMDEVFCIKIYINSEKIAVGQKDEYKNLCFLLLDERYFTLRLICY